MNNLTVISNFLNFMYQINKDRLEINFIYQENVENETDVSPRISDKYFNYTNGQVIVID